LACLKVHKNTKNEVSGSYKTDTVASSEHTVVSSLNGESDMVASSRHTVVSSLTGDSNTVVSPHQYSKMYFYVFAHKILFSNLFPVPFSPMHP